MEVLSQLPREPNIECLILFVTVLFSYFFIYSLYFGPFIHTPGPRSGTIFWYYIAWYDFWLCRNQKIAQWHQRYGPVVCFRPGEVSMSDPDIVREVYGTAGKYIRSDLADNFVVYEERPIFATGPARGHQRKCMAVAPLYHKTALSRLVTIDFTRASARKVVTQIEHHIKVPRGVGMTIDAFLLFNRFVFDNITWLQYGAKYGTNTIEDECHKRDILVGIKQGQIWGPLKYNFPWLTLFASKMLSTCPKAAYDLLVPESLQLCLNSEAEFASWSWRVTNEAAKNLTTLEDYTLLSRLLGLKEKEGSELTFKYIAAEIFDNIAGGEETLAVGMVYLSYHLA